MKGLIVRKVLIANRGEIAVRLVRACRDAGLIGVAVYADPDRDALHVRLADEAYTLDGSAAADTYLRADKLVAVARACGADAVHPGYGFLSENADFAEAVRAAGLTWIGPPPSAIRALGDKVSARRVARAVGAPLVAGTPGPVADAADAVRFAEEHGLPVAIKAVHGGGGRGLKVAHRVEDVPELFASAVREARAAFGRGECYLERFLSRPRHVETQCLADVHGDVVVLSTRDCTLQRRHQKLVEEAPAPFLEDGLRAELVRASKGILRAVGYVGAGTCEFLVGEDGTASFLEVNTRLQVEHPVTEEVTGVDVVQEMFRLAAGEPLGYEDPPVRGHAIEFRINAEDAGRGFLPTPGRITTWRPPTGPGVRLDPGVQEGDQLGDGFDSLLAKLVVTGADRTQALARARRALAEFTVEGIATVLPFHRAVVDHPQFAPPEPTTPFAVHTDWVEPEFCGVIPPDAQHGPDRDGLAPPAPAPTRLTVEVNGRRVEVALPPELAAVTANGLSTPTSVRVPRSPRRSTASAAPEGAVVAPMQGSVIKMFVAEGQLVRQGEQLLVLEAMKMEHPVTADRTGRVSRLSAHEGATVTAGALLCRIDESRIDESRIDGT